MYHNLEDVPEPKRALVTKLYYCVLLTWVCLAYNFLAMCSAWFSGDPTGPTLGMWALIYAGFGVPGSWKLWYRSAFDAYKDNSTRNYCFFMAAFAMHLFFSAIMFFGVPGFAGAGLLTMATEFSEVGG